jgi:hypothetical protein
MVFEAMPSAPVLLGRIAMDFRSGEKRPPGIGLEIAKSQPGLLGFHDPAAGGALCDRPFAARSFGGPFLGGGHSAASAFRGHGYGIWDGFLASDCGRNNLPPGGVLLWGVTLLRAAPNPT